jgi:putative MATE family efflux protein
MLRDPLATPRPRRVAAKTFMQPRRSLTQGSISRGLLLFALPILFGNILQSLNGSINSIWVGRFLGEAALTATANANTVMFLLLGGVFGLSMAATVLVGQYIGAGNLPEAKRVVGTSTTFFFILSFALSAIGWLCCERLLRAMNTPADALPLAVSYMKVIFLALPFMYLYAFVMAVLRGAGDAKTPLYFMLVSVGLDIVLNPLLIFGWGPIPAFGITGSALATLIAQIVSLVALVAFLYRRKHMLVLHSGEQRLLAIDWTIASALIRKGIPMGLQLFVISFSGVLMVTLVNRFGVDTAAAYGAALQVWNYIQMPAFAVGMAVSAMAAQNVGARQWERVKATARVGVVYSLLTTGTFVALIEIFSRPALGLFLPPDTPALAMAEHLNRISAWSFMFFGVSMVLFGVVRATGAVMAPLIILTITMLLIRYPLAELLIDHWHADAIWWSFPISSAVAMLLAMLYYKFGGWRQAHMIDAPLRTVPSVE